MPNGNDKKSDTSRENISDPRAEISYGTGDASFQAAGGEAGIRNLVDRFYDLMETLPEAEGILRMHPKDLEVSRDKLARFLCGWLGGPKRYSEKYGGIQIPRAHARFNIAAKERDAWLGCMQQAVAEQPFADDFKSYLMSELWVPAERIRVVVAARLSEQTIDH